MIKTEYNVKFVIKYFVTNVVLYGIWVHVSNFTMFSSKINGDIKDAKIVESSLKKLWGANILLVNVGRNFVTIVEKVGVRHIVVLDWLQEVHLLHKKSMKNFHVFGAKNTNTITLLKDI